MAVADWIRVAILSLVWGGSFFFVEIMLQAMPPLTSVLGRLIVGLAGFVYKNPRVSVKATHSAGGRLRSSA